MWKNCLILIFHRCTIAYDKLLLELGKKKQHLIVVFDPNEKEIRTAKSERYNHIHPLCVPMVYQYNPFKDEVDIRPSNEGGIFSYYSSILEKLNEHSSSFAHTSIFSRSPIKKETYNSLLESTDWMIILDQNLKSWDISLQSESEKLFYKEDECRSIGIYSKNSRKFSLGYKKTIENLGNYIATEKGLENIIKTIRSINDDGLISIVSHSTNRIFDDNHGKGSLGLGIAAISYLKGNSDALLVGLDTQLAREWLSERDEGILPDLIGINIRGDDIRVDLMEVKTGNGDFRICGKQISGHAVEQVCVLDKLIKEIFGRSEKITTVSRREILRHHVFESLYSAELTNTEKHNMTEKLNQLFAGELDLKIKKNIVFVNFNSADTKSEIFEAGDSLVGNKIIFTEIGSSDIQKILSGISVEKNLFLQTEQANEIFVNSENEYDAPEIDKDVLEPFLEENDEKAEDSILVSHVPKYSSLFSCSIFCQHLRTVSCIASAASSSLCSIEIATRYILCNCGCISCSNASGFLFLASSIRLIALSLLSMKLLLRRCRRQETAVGFGTSRSCKAIISSSRSKKIDCMRNMQN